MNVSIILAEEKTVRLLLWVRLLPGMSAAKHFEGSNAAWHWQPGEERHEG